MTFEHPRSCQCWHCGYSGETWTIPIIDNRAPKEVAEYEERQRKSGGE